MASENSFLRSIIPALPSDFAKKVRTLCSSTSDSSAEYVLDTLIRFVSGAECAPGAAADTRAQWNEKQLAAGKILNTMVPRGQIMTEATKRTRQEDEETQQKASKRSKTSEDSSAAQPLPPDPLFTIHSVSVTSPARKKLDITVHKTALVLAHPTTHAIEANIPLSNFNRAFLIPTRGKLKAHWTIAILSGDTPVRDKTSANAANSNVQVIFGIDAVASTALTTSTYEGDSPERSITSKGSTTRESLLTFLRCLGIPHLEPTPDVFKSACNGITSGVNANEDGIPGVEAFRGAKAGNLYFTKQGILYGESRPCEFWALENLAGKSDGVRVIGSSGRICTVVLTRRGEEGSGEAATEEDSEDLGVESEFGMVDVRERPGIEAWVRTYRNFFGKKKVVSQDGVPSAKAKPVSDEPKTIAQIEDDSDDEDEDFRADEENGSDGSGSSNTSSDEDGGDEAESGSGNEEHEDEMNEDLSSEDELTEEHHPLLRLGAMPRRMNRAMVEMVANMVEDDLLGGDIDDTNGDEPEEDELED